MIRIWVQLKAIAEWCQKHRHESVDAQQKTLNAKLRGHYQYYGRPTNGRSLRQFYRGVRRIWREWLSRRTHGRRLTWERYDHILRQHPLLLPRIMHSWRTGGVLLEEPAAGNLHGGVCEGGDSVGQGGPKRARSRKRWKEAKGSLQPTQSPLLGERLPVTQEAAGSSPVAPANS